MANYYQAQFAIGGRHLRPQLRAFADGPIGVHSIPQKQYSVHLDVAPGGEKATAHFPHIYTDPAGEKQYVWILSVADSSTGAVLHREKVVQGPIKESAFLPPQPEAPLAVGLVGMREELDYFAGQTADMVTKIGEAFKEQVTASTTNITTAMAANTSTVTAAIHSTSREIGEDERERIYSGHQMAESMARIAESIAMVSASTEALNHRLTNTDVMLLELRREVGEIAVGLEEAKEAIGQAPRQQPKREK